MARRRRKNPWTHGVLGLGNTRAAAGLADAARMRGAERDRYNYLKDAVAAAKAGASLREIVALTHAAARIRKLTKDEAMRVVFARRLAQEPMRNPRGWTWAHAKAAAARRRRVRRPAKTDAEILAAPATQGSIEAAVKAAQANAHLGTETCLRRVREAVLAHARRRRNPNVDIVSGFRQVREAQRAVGRHSDLWRGLTPTPVRRRRRAKRANPGDRPRVLWFLVAGQHWVTATARGTESVRDALRRSYLASTGFARTNLQVTKPDGFTPGEWLGVISQHAVYKPQRTNANPPRDPRYVGAFTGAGPKRSKDYVDGDTAAVVSPYKPGRWEVWMFGMDDPSRGETWNYVGDAPNRADAEAHARKLLAYF